MFPPPSLKFRTSGFPQYGFKLEFRDDLHHNPAGLSTRPASARTIMTYTHPKLFSRNEAAQRATRRRTLTVQAVLRSSDQSTPVQRPLAPRWVVLSHRILAYYGLIRHSRSLRSIYGLIRTVFARRSCLGWSRELPQFNLCDFPCVPPSVPRWAQWLRAVVASPLVRVFAVSVAARHPHPAHADSHASRVTRLQSSLNATARKVACPSSARTFTSELSPPRVTPKKCQISLRGQQPITTAGLAPANHTALWAANGSHGWSRIRIRRVEINGIVKPFGDTASHLW